MSTLSTILPAARSLARHGVAFAPEITRAAAAYGLDPRLLAAVAAQETGGPGSNAGRNIVGDGGHGHGIFQIDDRYHRFARTAAAMQPQANADYAARMIAGLLKRYGGDVHKALSAYNAGDPNARGTVTPWQDGERLGYADSVLRHYAALARTSPQALADSMSAQSREEQTSVNALSSFAALRPPPAAMTTLAGEPLARDSAVNLFQRSNAMHLSLGGIVKGITSGLETFAETGNPLIAAGAGAVACFSGGGNAGASGTQEPALRPLLDALRAENPGERQNVNALSSFAQRQSDIGSLIDPLAAA